MENKVSKKVFAIIRCDGFPITRRYDSFQFTDGYDGCLKKYFLNISVKKVVHTKDRAESEVKRLNELSRLNQERLENEHDGDYTIGRSFYYYQETEYIQKVF